MKYFFILGKNVELSIAEIVSYFEKEEIKISKTYNFKNGFLVDVSGELKTSEVIKRLGGTLAIGIILFEGNQKELFEKIEKEEIYFESPIKFRYSLLDFCESSFSDKIEESLKIKFKKEGLKAYKNPAKGMINMQNGEIFLGSPSKLKQNDVNYFLFKNSEKNYFGILENIYDYKETEKRDMEKPERRESLAISPKLSQILINLSQVKKGETLLDCFCGVGVILQEALIQEINVVGIDLDKEAIESAKKNIAWLNSQYKVGAQIELINGNSRNVNIKRKVDAIATEPSLGILMKRVPNRKEAEVFLRNFESLMVGVLNNMNKCLKNDGKIAFTAPLVSIGRERVGCRIESICAATGLKISELKNVEIKFPIKDFRKDQIVGREFFVLERK